LNAAFVDTSAFLSVLLKEPGSDSVERLFGALKPVYASNLLEAEARSASDREGLDRREVEEALTRVKWVLPTRPLSQELRLLGAAGIRLKGADLWHVACALYLAGDPKGFPFLTLDDRQAEAARRLGFRVLPEADGVREAGAAYRARPSGRVKKAKGRR